MSTFCTQGIRTLLRASRVNLRQFVRHESGYEKAYISFINSPDEGATFIDAFSVTGFRLTNNVRIIGPMAVFPRSVLHWNVCTAEDINEDSLSLFTMLEPKIDILVIGKGEDEARIDPSIIKYLRSKKINVEILSTESACSTFNFLNSEKRYVAAALIPPKYVHNVTVEDDLEIQDDNDIFNLKTNYSDENPYNDIGFLEDVPKKYEEMKEDTDFGEHTHIDAKRDETIAQERLEIVKEMKAKGLLKDRNDDSKLKDEKGSKTLKDSEDKKE